VSAFSMHQQVARPAATQTKDRRSGFSGTFDMAFLALQFHSHAPRQSDTPCRAQAPRSRAAVVYPGAGQHARRKDGERRIFLPIFRLPRGRCAQAPDPAPEPTRPTRHSDRARKATTAYARQSPLCRRGRSWRANGAASTAIAAAASRTVKPSMLRGSAAHHPDELSLLLALSSREC
jgi:hypothetical protein